MTDATGPLAGIRVLEVGGIGPNPFAGMLLADMGADVIRLDRQVGTGFGQAGPADPSLRGPSDARGRSEERRPAWRWRWRWRTGPTR